MTIEYQIFKALQDKQQVILCIMDNATQCSTLYQSLTFLLQGTSNKVAYLPDYDVTIKEALSPSASIVSQRLATLHQLLHNKVNVVIMTYEVAYSLKPDIDFVRSHVLSFKVHDTLDLNEFRNSLVNSGYHLCSQVQAPNQFALRGGIIDLYPAHTQPIRIELDDDIIASIRHFDIESQRSKKSPLSSLEVCPQIEFNPECIDNPDKLPANILKEIQQGKIPTGWQQYLPQLAKPTHILNYIKGEPLILSTNTSNNWHDITDLSNHLISKKAQSKLQDAKTYSCSTDEKPTTLSIDSKTLKQDIKTINKHKRVLIACQSYFRLHQLESILLSHHIDFKVVDSFYESSSKGIQLALCHGDLADTIELDQDVILPEQNLTDKVILSQSKPKASMDINNIHIGDLMIHVDHGVGRFSGIETRHISGVTQDFVVIKYANDDQLLFPPDQLFKVHPYHGDQSSIDTLKSKKWQNRKARALKNIEAFSAKLLRLQTSRKENKISPIPLPKNYPSFVEDFPFAETADQLQIMSEIIKDFSNELLFDRLICGDVGFGKTEIAMRSAFIALENGYQVAIISPTTVLATQHFNNFQSRFKRFGTKISLLSRSNKTSSKDQEAIALGEIQLIIGTHKVLSQTFHNLGLVIIDEEHRFGVSQKDSISAFNQAHKLSLTATPIPRSLNMALSKLRQLSIMTTPPKSRLPILTFIEEESDEVITQAINREIHRGGQVYIIYNEVSSMPNIHKRLDKLLPHISFGVVHGQMPASSVEKQMARFHSKAFQVLIASTIIESGVDIPNANTIIIFRADKLGLSQLHQIRGRVGRSHHQAYAYMLTPHSETNKKAKMRLEAIANAMHLGSGYELSIADLEIRGAGNLLGDEQSGHVNAIGLSYYTHLLNQATSSGNTHQTEVDLTESAIIPETYIPDTEIRYQFYHKIANANTQSQIKKIGDELEDRFGKSPDDINQLLNLATIRVLATQIGILSIQSKAKGIQLDFGKEPELDHQKLLQVVSELKLSFSGPHHILVHDIQSLLHTLNKLAR